MEVVTQKGGSQPPSEQEPASSRVSFVFVFVFVIVFVFASHPASEQASTSILACVPLCPILSPTLLCCTTITKLLLSSFTASTQAVVP